VDDPKRGRQATPMRGSTPRQSAPTSASPYERPVSAPDSPGRTSLTAVNPGATSRLTRRPCASVSGDSNSQRTPYVSVTPALRCQSSSGTSPRYSPRIVLVGIAVADRAGVRKAEQEVGEVEAGGSAGEAETAAWDPAGRTTSCARRRSSPPRLTCGARVASHSPATVCHCSAFDE
jgi:hypothetical protein